MFIQLDYNIIPVPETISLEILSLSGSAKSKNSGVLMIYVVRAQALYYYISSPSTGRIIKLYRPKSLHLS